MAFFEAPSNQQAMVLLAEPGAWPQHRLAVWGEAGSGKSHLLDRWARRHRAMRVSGEGLAGEALAGLERPRGPLAIDDADLAAERPLLHVLNAASEAGYPVVIAGRSAPARWAAVLPDLDSRLRATLAVEIRPADDALLRALLAVLLADRQLAVPEAIQEFLLRRLARTPAAMRAAASRLDHLALAQGGRVTRAIAAAVVADIGDAEVQARREHHEDLTFGDLATSPDGPGFL